MRRGEAHALEAVDGAASTQQLAERVLVAELHAVRVHVLAEQRDLDDTVVDERLYLGEHVTGSAIALPPTQRRHDAERARVVAAHTDRDPRAVRRFAPRRQRRGKDLERLKQLDLG